MSKRNFLGEFQELVLLAIIILEDEAYGISIQEELEQRTGRKVSRGALHTALTRLSDKGYIRSHYGGATAERGGRRKRFYQLTSTGQATLNEAQELRDQFWQAKKVLQTLKG